MHLALIETSPPGQPGSMPRYADLIEQAFVHYGGNSITRLTRLNLAPSAATLCRWPKRLRNGRLHFGIMRELRRQLRREQFDLYHVVDGSCAYFVSSLPTERSIVTSHDIIPHLQTLGRFPVPPPSRLARRLIASSLAGLKSARHVIAVSERTAADLVEFAGLDRKSISVVHSAIPPQAQPQTSELPIPAWRDRGRSGDATILHIGNNGFYKNREGVVRVFARVCERIPSRLCLAGPPPSEALLELTRKSGAADRIDIVVNPDDARIRQLYREAHVLLFPSRYEGFGWPPLEAMAHGCPVVASTSGSLPEVIGEAGVCLPVDDEEGLAEACCQLLNDETRTGVLIEKGFSRLKDFSMQQMWNRLVSVYELVADRR